MTIKDEETPEPEVVVEPQESERLYPDPFYCPLTKQVLEDPVVDADGDSFERSAVLERDATDSSAAYYSNRALKIVIAKEKQRASEQGSVRGVLRRAEESMRAGFQQIVEKSALPSREYRPLPDAYYCSITLDLMFRPAIDPDGNSYERQAILGWIRANGTSPLTRNALSADQLRDNNALADLIDAEVNKTEGSIHPSIRRWKDTRKDELEEDEEAGVSPYPTSQEEIDELSAGKCVCGVIAIIFVFIAAIAAFVFFPLEAFFFALILCSCSTRSDANSG